MHFSFFAVLYLIEMQFFSPLTFRLIPPLIISTVANFHFFPLLMATVTVTFLSVVTNWSRIWHQIWLVTNKKFRIAVRGPLFYNPKLYAAHLITYLLTSFCGTPSRSPSQTQIVQMMMKSTCRLHQPLLLFFITIILLITSKFPTPAPSVTPALVSDFSPLP